MSSGGPPRDNALITPLTRNNEVRKSQTQFLKRSTSFVWIRIVFVCILLGISGGVRSWRDWQFRSLSKASEVPPFPLSDFPKVLGNWHVVEGSETMLEAEVARVSGSSDYMIRNYVDEKSGKSVVVMILYGIAYLVWPHTPDACYPAAGFKSVPPSQDVDIHVPDSTATARFRVQNFVKLRTGQGIHLQVYHSFLNAGRWGLDMQKNWKSFRYNPGMFKVQVQRQSSGTWGTEGSSIEALLGRIVQEIERRSTVNE